MQPPPTIMHTLYYYHDPMCSWCWAYRPTAERLFANLPADISRVDILGGLAPDSDEPMPKDLQTAIAGYWRRIHDTLGTEFNFDFWQKCKPRRSTYPACRAVLAAGRQDRYQEMLEAIQHAYYLRAMNPSELGVLESLAGELTLDTRRFAADLRCSEIDELLQQQLGFARRSPINGFPSLAVSIGDRLQPVQLDYKSHDTTLTHLAELCRTPT